MTMLPARTGVSDTYPNPTNAAARSAFGQLHDALSEAVEGKELAVASASTLDIGGQTSTRLYVTGNVAITSFGTNYRGPIFLRFASSLTLTHNGTTLILPGGANKVTAANDVAVVVPKATTSGTNNGWVVASYTSAAPLTAADLQRNTYTAFPATGENAYSITPTPPITAYLAGMEFTVTFLEANTAASTLQINGLASPPSLVRQQADGTYVPLVAGDIPAGHRSRVRLLNSSQAQLVELGAQSAGGMQVFTSPSTVSWIIPAGVRRIKVTAVGGGGGSAGTVFLGDEGGASWYGSSGGGGGGTAVQVLPNLVPGNTLTVTVGAGGGGGAAGLAGASGGASSVASGSQTITSVVGGGGGGSPVRVTTYTDPSRGTPGTYSGAAFGMLGGVVENEPTSGITGGVSLFTLGTSSRTYSGGVWSTSAGKLYGGGGAGADAAVPAGSGNAGAPGIVIIEW